LRQDEDVEDEEDDDDLFDSDEEEEITKRHAAGQDEEKSATKKSGKVLGRKKKAAPVEKGPRRSGRKVPSKYSDDDEEEEVEDGEERDEDDNQRKNRRVSSGDKRLSKSGGDLHEYETDSDEDDETRRERVAQRLADLKDDSPVAGLDFYLRIQSRRMVLEKWLSEPFFEQAVVGTFLRLSIGECDGQAVYRMCEVIAVEYNQRPYRLESGKMCGVRLTVSLAGSVKKGSKISVVSNSRITHNEFGVFVVEMQKATERNGPSENTHLLTENQVNARRQKQLKASRHVYTHTEIRDMVRKKSGMNKALVTEYSTAMESLIKKRDEARVDKDLDALEAVQKTIDMLEAESKKQKEMNERSSKHSIEVNKRSRESNVQRDMAAGMRKRAEEQEAAAKGTLSNAVLDPFLRRETRPKILWNTGSKLREEQAKENGTFTGPAAAGGAATNGQSAGAVNGAVPGTSAVDAHAPPTVLWSIKNPEATLEEVSIALSC
jgi:RNA polymerase-associated protein RTF1